MASIQVLVPADPYPPCADTNRDGDPVGGSKMVAGGAAWA